MKKIFLLCTTLFLLNSFALVWAECTDGRVDIQNCGYRATQTPKEITDLSFPGITSTDTIEVQRKSNLDEFVPTKTREEWQAYQSRAKITKNTCGDGVLDPNEECDGGYNCNSSCKCTGKAAPDGTGHCCTSISGLAQNAPMGSIIYPFTDSMDAVQECTAYGDRHYKYAYDRYQSCTCYLKCGPGYKPDSNHIGCEPTQQDAKCGTGRYGCDGWTTSGMSYLPETSTEYRWRCYGLNGGSDIDCSWPKNDMRWSDWTSCMSSDVCGNALGVQTRTCSGSDCPTPSTESQSCTLPPCEARCGSSVDSCGQYSSYHDIADTSTHYRWKCWSLDRSLSKSCQKEKTLNGRCGNRSAPYLCEDGDVQNRNFNSNNDTHYWRCSASGSGTPANCSWAEQWTDWGRCIGSDNPSCGTGNQYRTCTVMVQGGCSGESSRSCTLDPCPPKCATTHYNCSVGTPSIGSTTNEYWRWSCNVNGQKDICSEARPGKCGNSVYTCESGQLSNTKETDNHWEWRCAHAVSGSPGEFCDVRKPSTNFACGHRNSTCGSGWSFVRVAYSPSYYWVCSNGSTEIHCAAPGSWGQSVTSTPF